MDQNFIQLKKTRTPGNNAIATVAEKFYYCKSPTEIQTFNQLSPKPMQVGKANNLYTWLQKDKDAYYNPWQSIPKVNNNFTPQSKRVSVTSPSYLTKGGISPPVYGVQASPPLLQQDNSFLFSTPYAGKQAAIASYIEMTPVSTPVGSGSCSPVTDAPCLCQKSPKMIFCKSCLQMFTGRMRTKCPAHPKKIFLMDFENCINCQSDRVEEVCDA